jgi:hypothetical protein
MSTRSPDPLSLQALHPINKISTKGEDDVTLDV